MGLNKICNNLFEVSVNWENLYELRCLSKRDTKAKKKYNSALNTLVSLDILSITSKGHYGVELPGHNLLFELDNRPLYWVNSEDVIKVKNSFNNSYIAAYE